MGNRAFFKLRIFLGPRFVRARAIAASGSDGLRGRWVGGREFLVFASSGPEPPGLAFGGKFIIF